MSKTHSFLWRWGPAFLMMVVIFGFSSIPASEMPNFDAFDYVVKKGGHALGYGLLALLYLHGLKGNRNELHLQRFFIAWMSTVIFSITDEFHQSFVPGRHPAVTDVMIDAFGSALALFLTHRFDK